MDASPWTISDAKFSKLSPAGQHHLLAQIAQLALRDGIPLASFQARYGHLHALNSLDRYSPPHWLSEREALEEYACFHQERALKPPNLDDAPALSWNPRFKVSVALDQVRSPYNIGSILRLIDNFGMQGLIHATSWLDPRHPRLVHAARGAERWIPIKLVEDLPRWLQDSARPIVAIEEGQNAQDLADWDPPSNAILVLGNETYGLSQAIRACAQQMVRIPNYGYKNSMNVSHAFAVVAQRIAEKLANQSGPQ